MSAYRCPGRLTPAAQRLDLIRARANRRILESAVRTPGMFESGWDWTDLKTPASAPSGAPRRDHARVAGPPRSSIELEA